MWWQKLLRGEDEVDIPEVPKDLDDAVRLRAYAETGIAHVTEAEEKVDSIVGSSQGFHRANHFSQMAMESMSRLKE